MTVFLTKEQILDAKIETEEVEVWGGKILVKALSAVEREEIRKDVSEDEKSGNLLKVQIKLVTLTVVDASGKRLFNQEDVEKLADKSARELDKIFIAAQRLAGLGQQNTEIIEKN